MESCDFRAHIRSISISRSLYFDSFSLIIIIIVIIITTHAESPTNRIFNSVILKDTTW